MTEKNILGYIQDVSVPKEVRDLYFISIPRKRSSRRKLIKTRPEQKKKSKQCFHEIFSKNVDIFR